jgi:hypothetical protein
MYYGRIGCKNSELEWNSESFSTCILDVALCLVQDASEAWCVRCIMQLLSLTLRVFSSVPLYWLPWLQVTVTRIMFATTSSVNLQYYCHVRLSVFLSFTWVIWQVTSQKITGSRPFDVSEFFSIYRILPAALGPGVYSASNRNEYQKQKSNVSGE